MCLADVITDEYNRPLKATNAHIGDDIYNMVNYGAAGQISMDLLEQLQSSNNACTHAIRLSSAHVLV